MVGSEVGKQLTKARRDRTTSLPILHAAHPTCYVLPRSLQDGNPALVRARCESRTSDSGRVRTAGPVGECGDRETTIVQES